MDTNAVLEALKNVIDPDLKKDIVTLGMVKDLFVENNTVKFKLELTTPACPLKDVLKNACINAIKEYVNKDAVVEIEVTSRVRTSIKKENSTLKDVKHIIAVASGKGGVGKSTISANLALALQQLGAKTGLLDADIYGPSQSIIFGVEDEVPGPAEFEGQRKMAPVVSYGIKLNSIGFMAKEDQPIALRGPMVSKALQQLFYDTVWGELDYLIVDLPPGTGDIQITLCGNIPLSGAVVVCTPQKVAIADAKKAIGLFKLPQINVPILGLVENMSWFTPEELPDNKYYIFGKDGIKNLSEETNIPLLAQIPLVQSIRESADEGVPSVIKNDRLAQYFIELAQKLAQQVSIAHQLKQTGLV
ncbi:MAG: Mrp/NBP35 family ATP-binding protein [Bacteroidia bacterium]